MPSIPASLRGTQRRVLEALLLLIVVDAVLLGLIVVDLWHDRRGSRRFDRWFGRTRGRR